MCVMLADFLRRSLALGGRPEITLAEELDLAERYLEIEHVRFGNRLRVERDIDSGALRCMVPALLLQPLVENAVTHGHRAIAHGGSVRLTTRRVADRLEIEIENPADADRPPSRGSGLGLPNVRSTARVSASGRDAGRMARGRGPVPRARAAAGGRTFDRYAIRRPGIRSRGAPGGRMNATDTIKAVIVDDEPLARQLLREYLSVHHDVELVAECENGFDAIKAVAEHTPTCCSSTSRCRSSTASRCSSCSSAISP